MLIKRTSVITGKSHEQEIAVTQKELDYYYGPQRPLLQNAFPNLTADERDFIKFGITPEEGDKYMKDDDD